MDVSLFTDDADERDRWSAPDNEVPAVLGPVVLAADDEAAVVLASVLVHSTGLELTIECRRRVAARSAARGDIRQDVLVGVELADGRRVVADRGFRHTSDPSLMQRGGSADDRSARFTYWLSPQPPAGDVLVVVHAVDLGVPEARTTLAAADLAAARDRVVELWPWTPQPDDLHEPPPAPVPPAGGRFDQGGPPSE